MEQEKIYHCSASVREGRILYAWLALKPQTPLAPCGLHVVSSTLKLSGMGRGGGVQNQSSEGKVVPVPLCLQPTSPGLNVIVLDEAIIILFTHVREGCLPYPGQLVVLVAGMIFAAEVAFGSKRYEEGEDHSAQHNPDQHRPCPGPGGQCRGHG